MSEEARRRALGALVRTPEPLQPGRGLGREGRGGQGRGSAGGSLASVQGHVIAARPGLCGSRYSTDTPSRNYRGDVAE